MISFFWTDYDFRLAISVVGQKTYFITFSENAVSVGRKEERGGKEKGRVN